MVDVLTRKRLDIVQNPFVGIEGSRKRRQTRLLVQNRAETEENQFVGTEWSRKKEVKTGEKK